MRGISRTGRVVTSAALIDATVIRALIGRWNWWLPRWRARVCASSRRYR